MRKVKRNRPLLLVLCATCCCFSKAGLAGQGNGDYDGDYDVDGEDFAWWAECMAGVEADLLDPWSACSAFDFDGDGDVDLHDFGGFQFAFQKPPTPGCTPAPPPAPGILGRFHIGVEKSIPGGLIGARAYISGHPIKLCAEGTSTARAFSLLFVGVGGPPGMWAQIGYQKQRVPSGLIIQGIYAETSANRVQGLIDICINNTPHPTLNCDTPYPGVVGLPSTSIIYKCRKPSNQSGQWLYSLNNVSLHSWSHSNWAGVSGEFLHCQGELHNEEDDLPGTPTDKCFFQEIRYKYAASGGWADAGLVWPTDFLDPDSQKWGVERVSGKDIRVWDKVPNQ